MYLARGVDTSQKDGMKLGNVPLLDTLFLEGKLSQGVHDPYYIYFVRASGSASLTASTYPDG